MTIAIIDYDGGNACSVGLALDRLGLKHCLTADPEVINRSSGVIFPGVGHAHSVMSKLRERHLDQLLPSLKQPVLGICVGMQLLYSQTEEGPTSGLSIIDGIVKKFPPELRVPHTGWSAVLDTAGALFDQIKPSSYFYFVHSYFPPLTEASIAVCDYGLKFASASQCNNFFGVQFHPERSGEVGATLLNNFAKICLQ